MSQQNILPRPATRLASKPRPAHPNHHLVNNNGIWWCQITVHHGHFSKRLRFSLKTRELDKARAKRDRLLETLSSTLNNQ